VCTSLSRLQRDSPPARGLSGLKGQSEREPLEVEGPISCLRYAITHGGHVDKVRCPSGGEQLCAHDIKSPGARVNDRLVTQHLLSCLFAFRSLIDKQSFTSILTFLPTGLPAYTRSSDTCIERQPRSHSTQDAYPTQASARDARKSLACYRRRPLRELRWRAVRL
jgi:hypothetical protein